MPDQLSEDLYTSSHDPERFVRVVKTMSVPEAGRVFFGIGRNASYEAARRGDIPTIKIGRLKRVSVAAMSRKLDEAADK